MIIQLFDHNAYLILVKMNFLRSQIKYQELNSIIFEHYENIKSYLQDQSSIVSSNTFYAKKITNQDINLLLIFISLKMNSPSQTFYLQNPNFPTIQSIEAQSEYSVDLKHNQHETAIMQILLLSIELDRKDMIIDELQNNAVKTEQLRKSHVDIQHSDLKYRYQKLETQNRSLIQSNAVLRSKIGFLERASNELQLYKQNAKYNQQLEQRLHNLESRLKQSEQAKIQSLENQKKLKQQLLMLSYANGMKASDKSKIRELQTQLSIIKAKLQKSQISNTQNKHLIQKFNQQIHYLKQQQMKIIRNYQDKIQLIQVNQDLKKSQVFAATDQKVTLLTQQLNRLRSDLQNSQQQLKKKQQLIQQRNIQINKLNQDLQCYQKQLQTFQRNHRQSSKLEQQLLTTKRQLVQTFQKFNNSQNYTKIIIKQKEQLQQIIKSMENSVNEYRENEKKKKYAIDTLQKQLANCEDKNNILQVQIRKLKRAHNSVSQECQICKIKSQSKIPQKSSKASINFDELIQETQKLKLSTNKIQNLINYHQLSSQNSLDLKSNSRITYHQQKS